MINLNAEIKNMSKENSQSSMQATPEKRLQRPYRKSKNLDVYALDNILGYGQTGITYKAYRGDSDDDYALKLYDSRYTEDKHFRKILEDEIRLSQNIAYGFAPICDHGVFEGQHYAVRQKIQQGNMEDIFQHNNECFHSDYRTACLTDVKNIACTVLQNLSCLHRDGFVHGNIKKTNIIWDPSTGKVLLTDYGQNGLKTKSNLIYDPYLLYYQPREQVLNPRKLTPSADLFAVGMFMYNMVQVEGEFHGSTNILNCTLSAGIQKEIAQGINFQPVKQLIDSDFLFDKGCKSWAELGYNPDSDDEFPEGYEYYYINPEFAEVINKAIRKDPSERYQSAEEFHDALDKVIVC